MLASQVLYAQAPPGIIDRAIYMTDTLQSNIIIPQIIFQSYISQIDCNNMNNPIPRQLDPNLY